MQKKEQLDSVQFNFGGFLCRCCNLKLTCGFRHTVLQLLASLLFLLHPELALACTLFPLAQPAAGRSVAELQPELRWKSGSAAPFRIQISVVAPEAKVLMSVDTVVNEPRYKLPSAIPANFAAVKVLVSQNCSQLDAQDLNGQGPAFFLDSRASCVLQSRLSRKAQGTLGWGKSEDAESYVVRMFTANIDSDKNVSLKLLETQTMSGIELGLNSFEHTRNSKNYPLVVSVQPVCSGRPGVTQSIFLPSL